MVVWEDGQMKKSDYRKFIIKTVDGVDDFASMREVVTRRYKRVTEDKLKMPSLILIDGGIGQFHAAAEALEPSDHQPAAGFDRQARGDHLRLWAGGRAGCARPPQPSPASGTVIRDEAHSFAITFHRKRREMRDRTNELDDIPGIGLITRRRLLEHFGSVKAVKKLTRQRSPLWSTITGRSNSFLFSQGSGRA